VPAARKEGREAPSSTGWSEGKKKASAATLSFILAANGRPMFRKGRGRKGHRGEFITTMVNRKWSAPSMDCVSFDRESQHHFGKGRKGKKERAILPTRSPYFPVAGKAETEQPLTLRAKQKRLQHSPEKG